MVYLSSLDLLTLTQISTSWSFFFFSTAVKEYFYHSIFLCSSRLYSVPELSFLFKNVANSLFGHS